MNKIIDSYNNYVIDFDNKFVGGFCKKKEFGLQFKALRETMNPGAV